MERLRIKNFLIIEETDFEVGRFNIIIGSQASGKSIIAKILFLCRAILTASHRKEFGLKEFEKVFPRYTWEKKPFEIYYQFNNIEIHLKYETEFNCSFSGQFDNLNDIVKPLFIPANRTLFAFIQENIFSLLSQEAEIDFFIVSFFSFYERAKINYSKYLIPERFPKIKKLVESILKGEYVNLSGIDWIKDNNQLISLANASSGQQESLPMLIVLAVLVNAIHKDSYIFIEEPEAHLFPVSQKQIIELLSLLYNQGEHNFVITTHSPYILTAINNAILAHDVISEKGKEAVKAIFDPDFAIKYEDVRAYTIEDGKLISILDDETRLIGASVIDSVSDEFENVFNSLLEL